MSSIVPVRFLFHILQTILIFQIVCSAYRPYTEFSAVLEHNDNLGYDTDVISFDRHVPPPVYPQGNQFPCQSSSDIDVM